MLRIKIPCWLGIVQASLTLLSLRCGIVNCELSIMMLRIKIPCLLGIAQINLALLSLRCGIVNCKLSIVNSLCKSSKNQRISLPLHRDFHKKHVLGACRSS